MRKQKRLNRQRQVRKFRVTNKVKRFTERLRLSVFRSAKHIYAQIIDDQNHNTLVSACTLDKEFKEAGKSGGNCDAAAFIGGLIAQKALAKDIKQVAFDRSGHKYHGRIKALADAARDAGLDIGAKAVEEAPASSKSAPKKGGDKKPAKKEKK